MNEIKILTGKEIGETKMKVKATFFILLAVVVIGSCKKAYTPTIVAADNKYLVVEGLINTGPDSTYIKLSRTVQLASASVVRPELGAVVTVESDQNASYALQEAGKGLYDSPTLNLSSTAKYRLRIKTSNGKVYLSDFVEAKSTPDIDSISYDVQNGGVQFYANAHDPQNKTTFYRWDYDETWQYVPNLESMYKVVDSLPVKRNVYQDSADNVYNCYFSDQAHEILLGSSAKLGQDVIFRQPIGFITAESGKLSHAYSVLLRQYALTPDGYAYWQLLKKNTEQLGSIFDAQPSSLKGNIHNVSDPNEPVIGFVSASSVKNKRLYVDRFNIKLGFPYYTPPPGDEVCSEGTKFIYLEPKNTFKVRLMRSVGTGDSLLLHPVQPIGAPEILGYYYAEKECTDCRAKSPFGSNVKPVFFPY